jgi:hypothetical protein
MDSIINTITTLVDYLIEDEAITDEQIFQLGVRLENLSKDCMDSINYTQED